MMIAFYFGDKSLKHLRNPSDSIEKKQPDIQAEEAEEEQEMIIGNVDMEALRDGMVGDEAIVDEGDDDDDIDDFDVKGSEG